MNKRAVICIGLALSFLPCVLSAAGTVGTGTAASCTEAALDAALAGGGLVTFNCGGAPVTITLTSQKTITVGTTVDGGGLITLSGGNTVTIFRVDNGAATPQAVAFTVQNITLANASGPVFGGGAIFSRGALTVSNSTIRNNSGRQGAGVFNNNGTLVVNNSTFSNNSGTDGGAIDNEGTATISNSTFSANSGSGTGGAIDHESGVMTLTNLTFTGNTAGATIADDNSATMNVTNVTIASNSGSGISGLAVTLRNTIIANNTTNCLTAPTNGGNNLQFPGSTCGASITSANPLLGSLANNGGPTQTMDLSSGSPAIDAANPAFCPATDQRGQPRVGICDIGAVESAFSPVPTIPQLGMVLLALLLIGLGVSRVRRARHT